jgi:hypothetical protein
VTDARHTQEVVDAFLRGFLRPLLTGGTVHVGRALAPGVLEAAALSASTDPDSDAAVLLALHESAAELAPTRHLTWPDRDAIALALACHDLAVLSDPMLDRAFARGARKTIAGYVRTLTESAAPARTRGAALLRHALVSRFLLLERTDTTVRNWAYTYRFFGRPVPGRFTAWKTVRRVRSESSQTTLLDVLTALPAELEAPALLDALLARSPVTRILLCDPGTFRVDWALASVLGDGPLRGGLVRALLERDMARAGEAVGAALLAQAAALRSGKGSEPPLVRAALVFAFELQATALLGRDSALAGTTPAAIAAIAAFAALVGTPEGAELSGVRALDPDDLRTLRDAAIDARRRVGENVFQAAHTLVLAASVAPASSLAPRGAPPAALSPALEALP